jgi:hypothetical protein
VGTVEWTLGRLPRARDAFGEVVRDFAAHSGNAVLARGGLARVEWHLGRIDEARSLFDETLRELRNHRVGPFDSYFLVYWPIKFLVETGCPPERLLDAARVLIEPFGPPLLTHAGVSVDLARSLVARAAGGLDDARDAAERAIAVADRAGLVEWAWRARVERGAIEPDGSTERAAAWGEAARRLRSAASAIRDLELRRAYLDHPERAWLASFDRGAPDADDPPTVVDPADLDTRG